MLIFTIFVVAGIFGFYTYLVSRHVLIGWCSLLAIMLLSYTFQLNVPSIGGLNLRPLDIVQICLLIAGTVRTLARWREPNTPRLLGALYLVLFLFSLVRGTVVYGFAAAANESRGYVGVLIGILYFLTAPADLISIRKYVDIYLWYSGALVLVAVLAYSGLDVGLAATASSRDSGADGRWLPAAAVASFAVSFLFSLGLVQYHRRTILMKCLPLIFLITAIYLRHRTVWCMLAVCIACLSLVERGIFRRLLPVAIVSILILAALISFAPDLDGGVNASKFEVSADSSATWQWRVDGWRDLVLDEDQTPLTVLMGSSMGGGAWRIVSGNGVNVAAHDEYVSEYLRVGLVGLLFLLWYVLHPLRSLWMQRFQDNLGVEPSAGIWLLVIVGILIYGVPYSIGADLYALLAMANATVVRLNNENETESTVADDREVNCAAPEYLPV